jgi:hypothetical protein
MNRQLKSWFILRSMVQIHRDLINNPQFFLSFTKQKESKTMICFQHFSKGRRSTARIHLYILVKLMN